MMRSGFQAGLDALELALQDSGALVVQAVRGALVALEDFDEGLVDHLAGIDADVDERFLQIERDVETLLARQAPVAGDLRVVLTVLHVNLHLERMSHNATRVAWLCEPTDGLDSASVAAIRVGEMTRVALDALALRDLDRAHSLQQLDELVDEQTGRVLTDLLERGDEDDLGPRAVLIARCLERIGDHAVKIGERVAYLLTGELREFTAAA